MKGHKLKGVLQFALTVLFLCGCKSNDSSYVKKIWNKELDYSGLYCDNKDNADPLLCFDRDKTIKIVSYIDSMLCTPCLANYMEASSRYIDSLGSPKVAFICIMRPRPIEEIRASIADKKISRNMYILFDSMNVFLKTNRLKDYPTQLQVLLLDRDNKVVLVGDPIRISKIRTLYSSVILEMINNDGVYRD